MKLFRYDEKNSVFVEVDRGIKWLLKTGLILFACSLALSVLYYVIFLNVYSTKEEKLLERDNALMEKEIASIERRMNVLDSSLQYLQLRDRDIYRTIFKAEPPALTIADKEMFLQSDIDTGKIDRLIHRTSDWVKELEKHAEIISLYIRTIEGEFDQLGSDVLYIPSIVPLRKYSISQFGASYGQKITPFFKTLTKHNGIDLIASGGTEVLAAGSGVVDEVAQNSKGDGNVLVINHLNGYKTRYCHLASIKVRRGQSVKKGTVIATVGNTGISLAPHLHYEVMYRGAYVDPVNYFFADLTPAKFRNAVSISTNAGQSLD